MKFDQLVKHVVITEDFTRIGIVNDGFSNLRWLEKILGLAELSKSSGVLISVLEVPVSGVALSDFVGNCALFESYCDDASNTWANLYDSEQSLKGFSNAFAKIAECDLVLGFELSPLIKKKIDIAGKSYVNFSIYPLRFLRDILMGVSTNSPRIQKLVSSYEISEIEISRQIKRFKALFSRLHLPEMSIPRNIPVFISQTKKDSVLIENGRFLELGEFDAEINSCLADYSEVVVLEHPHNKGDARIPNYIRGRHGKTVISIDANSYGILFSDKAPPFFFTMASSLGVEAISAGHECQFLMSNPLDRFYLRNVDISHPVGVGHGVLTDEFWSEIFFEIQRKSTRSKKSAAVLDFSFGDNYLRNSLESWAFSDLQFGLKRSLTRKRIFPAVGMTNSRLKEVLLEVGGNHELAITPSHSPVAWGEISVESKPPGVGDEVVIDFANKLSDDVDIEGFHSPEVWGVWSKKNKSRIAVPLGLPFGMLAKIRLFVLLKIFVGNVSLKPTLKISINGNWINSTCFKNGSDQRCMEFSVFSSQGILTIDFEFSELTSPMDIGASTDSRKLGFGLSGLSYQIIETSSPG